MSSNRYIIRKLLHEAVPEQTHAVGAPKKPEDIANEPTDYLQNKPVISKGKTADARRMPRIEIDIPYSKSIPETYMDIIKRPSIAQWAGYKDPKELQFLGGGVMGYAFLLPNGKVMKMTSDVKEAISSAVLIGKQLRNVLNVYDVARVKNTLVYNQRMQQYHKLHIIINEYIPQNITSTEGDAVDYILASYREWAKANVADGFVNFNVRLSKYGEDDLNNPILNYEDSYINNIEKPLRKKTNKRPGEPGFKPGMHGDLAVAKRRARRKMFNPDAPDTKEYMTPDEDTIWRMSVYENRELVQKIWEDIKNGLMELGRVGIGFVDFHHNNMRKSNDGRYIMIDIGMSNSKEIPNISVIENMKLRIV